MSLRKLSASTHSQILQRTATIAARTLLILTPVVIACFLLTIPVHTVHASGSLSTGSIQTNGNTYTCSSSGWLTYNGNSMTCQDATAQNCSNAADWDFTYGYLSPVGIVSGINSNANVKGVIVYFNGSGGTLPSGGSGDDTDELLMLKYYLTQGYEIVQLRWKNDWEATYIPFNGNPASIQNAACRPATFLSYIYSGIYNTISQANASAGMCAQGASAGSAQVVYSMAYYGINFLDNVELISGPVFGDIEQGCVVPNAANVTVCPSGQYGCQLGTDASWSLPPTYDYPQTTALGAWTNNSSCAGSGNTSPSSNTAWLKQSIVDQPSLSGGATPTFTYSNTAMTAWLCRTVISHGNNCATNYNEMDCPNNSSPQGQIFYAQITSSNPPPHYNVYSVDNCTAAELVYQGTVTAKSNETGITGITQDMAGGGNVTAQCFHGLHTQ